MCRRFSRTVSRWSCITKRGSFLFTPSSSQGPIGVAAALARQPGGDCLTTAPTGPAALKTTEPNFYVLGAKSYGRNSHFLMKNGFEQVREVFTVITGKSDLNLYGK